MNTNQQQGGNEMKTKKREESKHAQAETNPLNNNIMVWAKDKRKHYSMYACKGWKAARQMMKTMDHYIDTGKIKAFS